MSDKITLGQHIEYGLTNLGDRIYASIIDSKDHELETINLGLMSDNEKLRFLKQDLYQAVRAKANSEYVADLLKAIETIELSIERKHRRDTEPIAIINSFIWSAILMTFSVVCFSFPVTTTCKKYHSQFCNTSRHITNNVISLFFEKQ